MVNILIIIFLLIIVISMYIILKTLNPIYSVLNLIIIFWCYACILIILDMEFLACIFILVNVGAVALLFLFIIMMININVIEIKDNLQKYYPFILLFIINFLGLILLLIINYELKLPFVYDNYIYQNYINKIMNIELNLIFLSKFQRILNEIFLLKNSKINRFFYENIYEKFIKTNDIKHIGSNLLYVFNNLWFILACLILLVAMIGVIHITEDLIIKRRLEGNKSQDLFEQISKNYKITIKFYELKIKKK